MATNYNYGSAVSDIIKYKKWWQDADAAGDETAKNNHANSATSAYEWLRNNGYGDAANTLQASNYTDAKKWATNGKQQTRPYSYSVGQKYGLSNSDVDKIITTAKVMMSELIELQLSGSVEKAEKYINKYFKWTDDMKTVAEIKKKASKLLNGKTTAPLSEELNKLKF